MIKTETEEDAEFILKKKITSKFNQIKDLINLLESNLEHENEEKQKKTALISIAFINVFESLHIEIEEIIRKYKKFNEDKENGH